MFGGGACIVIDGDGSFDGGCGGGGISVTILGCGIDTSDYNR